MKVLAIGELTVDWLSLEKGETMLSARNFYRYPGGNAANVAVIAARLGLNSSLIAKIGNDLHGQYLLSFLNKERLDLSQLKIVEGYPTAQCYMTTEAGGSPVYCNWPRPHAAQMLEISDVSETFLADADVLHCTGISLIGEPRRSAVKRACELAKRYGVILSYDACFPTGRAEEERQIAASIMQLADIIKVNLSELSFWSAMPEDSPWDEMAAKLLSSVNPCALVVTLAEKGALIYTKDGRVKADPYPASCQSDVGAGDAFMAGLYFGLGQCLPQKDKREALYALPLSAWPDIVRPACLAGALAVEAIGATEGFPGLAEFQNRLGLKKLSP